ncbi:hypothetical protein EY01_15015, partial [Staphylococcus aureus]
IQGTAIAQKILSSGLKKDRLTNIEPHQTFWPKVKSYTKRIEKTYLKTTNVQHRTTTTVPFKTIYLNTPKKQILFLY